MSDLEFRIDEDHPVITNPTLAPEDGVWRRETLTRSDKTVVWRRRTKYEVHVVLEKPTEESVRRLDERVAKNRVELARIEREIQERADQTYYGRIRRTLRRLFGL